MAKRKTTVKVNPSALGDDPLAWITEDAATEKINIKETQPKKAKASKKSTKKTTKKIQAVKKPMVKKAPAKKVQANDIVKNTSSKNNVGKGKILQQTQIKLDPVLVISDAQTLYAQLGVLLDTKQNITIDASAVEMLDTAILQLLLAFVIKVKAQSRDVIWINPSEEMIRRVTTLNLQAGLGLDRVA
jgi:anti-anti-sigma regulatory factor